MPGRAASITKSAVTLEDGTQIPFDYCVLATGATHAGKGVITPGSGVMAERKQELQVRLAHSRADKEVHSVQVGVRVCCVCVCVCVCDVRSQPWS